MIINVNGVACSTIDEVRNNSSKDFADFLEEYLNDSCHVKAHTSGSTGTPKEILLQKSDMRMSARLTNEFFGIGEGSVLYLPLSPSYIAGKMMIVRALDAGAAIYEEKPSNEPLANYGGPFIDLIAVVPSQLNFMINMPGLLDKVGAMIIGGGQLSEKMERWLADKGVNAYKTYGMTETCSHVALSKVSSTADDPYEAIGNIAFECDERGCLVVKTPHLSAGRYVTNDVVQLIDDKHFVWLGRIDNVINTGGIKVFPEEIEPKLAKLIPHSRFYVASRSSDKWGEELVLVVEYASLPENTVKTGEIKPAFIEEMKKVLPNHSVPRYYVAVGKFEETASGKVIRKNYN